MSTPLTAALSLALVVGGAAPDGFHLFGGTELVSPMLGLRTSTGAGEACAPSTTTACLDDVVGDRRFAVTVDFETVQGGGLAGAGRTIITSSVGLRHTGLFWFFGWDNPEVLVRVLDACAFNGARWVLASATTNVGFTMRVADTATGLQKSYANPDLTLAAPVLDTAAFPCTASRTAAALPDAPAPDPPPRSSASRGEAQAAAMAACIPERSVLCLDDAWLDARFRVTVDFATAQGGGLSGAGQAQSLSPLAIRRAGLFWFFDWQNPEMLVKVLSGCKVNGRRWVLGAAGTNVGHTLRVTDTRTGLENVYTWPDLGVAVPVADTKAFPCD